MKILLFLDSLRSGGKERRVIELIKGLQRHGGFECHVALMSTQIAYDEIYATKAPLYFLLRSSRWDPGIFWRLIRLCRTLRPDILHVWDSMTAVYAVPAKAVLGIPLVNSMITNAPKIRLFSKLWIRSRLTFAFSSVILSNSRAGLSAYNAPPEKSFCIHNGFDMNRIAQLLPVDAIRERFGIKTEKIVVMVASLLPAKDYRTYVSVAIDVLRARNDVTFLGIGEGPMMDAIRRSIPEEYRDRVLLPGRQSDVESIIQAASVGILLTNSDKYGEGISNAIMEYMVSGKPVIANDSGGTKEIVRDNSTGFIVDAKNHTDIRRKIETLLDNEHLALEMGLRGRELIQKEFSLDRMVSQFIGAYQRVVSSQPVTSD